MKVAIVSPYALDRPGGVQDQASQISSRLDAEGIESWLVGPGKAGPPGARLLGTAVSVPTNRSRAPIALRPGVLRQLRRAVEGADVVHVHEPFVPLVGWAVMADQDLVGVATFHADPSGAVRWGYRNLAPILRKLTGRLQGVSAVSETAASAVRAFVDDLRVIPNGVDTASFGGSAEPHRVAFLGRDEPRKGLDVLLRAWPAVRASLPSARLDVLGSMRRDLIDGVVFHGRVSDEDKRRLLGQAQVFVAPNLGGESFGITLVEGMASGCALVASDIPAFRSVGGAAARYFPVSDSKALAASLVELLRDQDEIDVVRQACRTRSELFDWATVLPAYIQMYRAAVGGA